MIYLKYFIYLNVYKEKFVIFSNMDRLMIKFKYVMDTHKSKIDFEEWRDIYGMYMPGGQLYDMAHNPRLLWGVNDKYTMSKMTPEIMYGSALYFYKVLLSEIKVPEDIIQEAKNDLGIGAKKKNEYFVTIGFDDANITIDKIKKCLKSLVEMTSVKVDHMVVEKFRKDDNKKIVMHNHVHMIVSADYAKSKVVQFIFQKVAKYVQSKNFVDVKPCLDAHKKYIQGNKIPEKMECVELDKKWREENNLSSFSF